jgi:hypothetical protein
LYPKNAPTRFRGTYIPIHRAKNVNAVLKVTIEDEDSNDIDK